MTYTTRDGRQLATRAAWQPHWAKALAYVSTVIPLGMAGTGVVTRALLAHGVAAAAQLGITPSKASKDLRHLEQSLGNLRRQA